MTLSVIEWHLKGTCIWIASFISILICISMMVSHLRQVKSYSVATLFAVLIASSGICMVVMEESTFLEENVHPAFAPEWLYQLRKFSLSNYSSFLRDFFPKFIDLLIICDCTNRYILICHPDKKDVFLSYKVIALLEEMI